MAKRKTDSAAPVASGPAVPPEPIPEAERMERATIGPGELSDVTPIPAERDLNILIEAQRIRRDPARFMAAKALPQAQRHYIV